MTPIAQSFELTPPIGSTDHVLGTGHGGVTMVEFGDFECPSCKQAAATVKLLLKEFGGRLRVGFRHFPLEEAHPRALFAAQAAECAGAQGKFWPMHDLLFQHQHALAPHQVHGYAASLDLDMARFTAEMNDTVYLQRIREHQASGRASGVRTTPTFFLNGAIVDVSLELESLFDHVGRMIRA